MFKFAAIVGFALLAATFAQLPDYECTKDATNCNSAVFPTRGDVLGCMYFCHLDGNTDSKLSRSEYDESFYVCAGAEGIYCNQTEFVPILMTVLPICESEAGGLYDGMSSMDGDGSSFVVSDVDALWNHCLEHQNETTTEHVLPYGFQPTWTELWTPVEDPSCSLPYP